jgi:hypothetical protein
VSRALGGFMNQVNCRFLLVSMVFFAALSGCGDSFVTE